MKYIHGSPSETYCAPILGNGEISLQIGADGSMSPDGSGKLIHANIGRCIWWEGRRYRGFDTKPLIPFGRFTQRVGKLSPIESEQRLDPESAEISCSTVYSDGTRIETLALLHTDMNLIAVKKRFFPASRFRYEFSYTLCRADGEPNALFETSASDGVISWRALDQPDCAGVVSVFSDAGAEISSESNYVTLSLEIGSECEAVFYILLADRKDHDSPESFADRVRADILADGFERRREYHRLVWADYFAEGHASVGDEIIDRVYKTALYHLKCYATKWSMPVGISDACWHGRFFAFDEHYMFQGLITSNHIKEARRVPEFRKNGLPIAIRRASSKGKKAARYPWETLEDGTEGAPIGFWNDHIFHMSMAALSEYEYYLYTLDTEFLRETAYPVISACAEFFTDQCLYRTDGKLIVGKCTDLERLGSGVENAYMTTCGVVSTLKILAESARLLGVDSERAAECERLAAELLASLPNDGRRYLPYPGCTDRSISAFSGTFPFDVIDRSDPLQKNAISDYLDYEDSFGNMYAVGSGVCSWYACWKSVVYSRLGMPEKAIDALGYVAGTAGDFDELFEINNRASRAYYHPWFTTAAGMYVHALDELLLRSEGNELFIASGLPEKYDGFDLRLAAKGGLTVEARAEKGRLVKLVVEKNENCPYGSVTVHLPERFGGDRVVKL